MDNKDRQILEVLQSDGRIAHTRLAEIVDLSAPAVLARVRKLEEQGIIRGYQAVVDPDKVGNPVICFIGVTLVHHQREPLEQFAERIADFSEVLEAYHLTGGTDYLLKIAVSDIQAVENFLINKLASIPGVDKVHTSMVLSPIKTHGVVPVSAEVVVTNGRNGYRNA